MNKMYPKDIKTTRLLLKIYDNGYEEELLHLLVNNKEHLKNVLSDWVYNINDIGGIKKLIKTAKTGFILKNLFAFCIWDISNMKVVGEIVLFNINWQTKTLEIGCFIYKEFEGRGIITEAIGACIRYCFDELEMETILAICSINNEKSQRVHHKWFKVYEKTEKAFIFTLTKEEYNSQNINPKNEIT